jgi:pre-mRNA-processing factor 6
MSTSKQLTIPPPQKTKFAPAPAGYIPGFGRGAVGFTTRSDIGPMRTPEPGPGGAPSGYVAGAGRGAQPIDGDADRGDYSETKYDEWVGYEGSLFANYGEYDDEDKEADDAYTKIDMVMDTRRKSRREERLKAELMKFRKEKPPVSQMFQDLKANLSKMSPEMWNGIPDVGDYKVKKVKRDKYVPVPDNVIESASKDGQTGVTIAPGGPGTETSVTNLNEFGEAKNTLLGLNLDKVSDSVTGQSVVDTRGYLTSLNSRLPIGMDIDIGDIKKARLLLKSVIETNPSHAPGWIAAARLEELDGKLQAARSIIAQGLQQCTDSEDLWLEAARLETPDKCRAVLATAATKMPQSVKIWLAAASKEMDKAIKIKILRRALQYVPHSVKLWKELIELEGEDETKSLLYRAVECCPHSLEMWLALAKLEDYENAKLVLNRARQELPAEPTVWIHAAKLEEAQGNNENVAMLISRGKRALEKNNATIKREDWLQEAELAEKSGSLITCKAIIDNTIDYGIDEDDKEKALLEDAVNCVNRRSMETARAIHYKLLELYPARHDMWIKAIEYEKKHGTHQQLNDLLKIAIEKCASSELFLLMYAKHQWKQGQINEAMQTLQNAFTTYPDNESIYLAKAKLHRQLGEFEAARSVFAAAREKCNSAKVWMQSVQLERELNNDSEAWKLCEEALKKYPNFPKLWMIAGHLQIKAKNTDKARMIYERGLELNKTSVDLWICAIHLEESLKNFPKARSIWEKAKQTIPNDPNIWYTAIRLEEHENNLTGAKYMLARGLQVCPKSGELWALAIEMEPKSLRNSKSVEALKHCDNDPYVILAVAKLFWKDRKYEKARKWLDRAIQINPDYGDAWVYNYKFELDQGMKENAENVKLKCKESEPRHGRLWISVSKKVENWSKSPEEILEQASKLIGNEFNVIE